MFFQFVEQLNQKCHVKGAFFMPYSPIHIKSLTITQPEIVAASKYIDIADAVAMQSIAGPAVTAFMDLKPVACFGFVPVWEGVAEAWLIADDKARTKPIGMTKVAKTFFDIAEISWELHRVQISVRTQDSRAHRWAIALGFREEGVMHKYGPDQADHYIMARYR